MTSLELSRRSFSDYDNDQSTEIFNSQEMRFCGGVKSIPLISRLFNQDYKSYPKAEHWTIKKKEKKRIPREMHDLPGMIFNTSKQ